MPGRKADMSAGASTSGGGGAQMLTEDQIVGRYKQLRGELGAISQKINELEADVSSSHQSHSQSVLQY